MANRAPSTTVVIGAVVETPALSWPELAVVELVLLLVVSFERLAVTLSL
jgi:hypothetical protein